MCNYPWESVKFFVCAVLHTHRFLDLLACIVDQLASWGGSNTSLFYLYLADRAFTYFCQDPESSIWTTSYESSSGIRPFGFLCFQNTKNPLKIQKTFETCNLETQVYFPEN